MRGPAGPGDVRLGPRARPHRRGRARRARRRGAPGRRELGRALDRRTQARIRDSRAEARGSVRDARPAPPPAARAGLRLGDRHLRRSRRRDPHRGAAPWGRKDDFLAAVGREWEAAAEPARAAGIRVVHPRFGVVLSPAGRRAGQDAAAVPPGARRAARQRPAVDELDLHRRRDRARLHHGAYSALRGPVELYRSRSRVDNRDFTRTLGRVLRRPAAFRSPPPRSGWCSARWPTSTLLASARVLPGACWSRGTPFAIRTWRPRCGTCCGRTAEVSFPDDRTKGRRPPERRSGFGHDAAIARSRGFERVCAQLPLRPAPRGRARGGAAGRRAARRRAARGRSTSTCGPSAARRSPPTSRCPRTRPLDEIGAGIPVTYVPARNTIFLSFALAWAEVLGASDIFIGVNALDYSGYPDCRPEFIAAFRADGQPGDQGGGGGRPGLTIHTPLIELSKRRDHRAGAGAGRRLRAHLDAATTRRRTARRAGAATPACSGSRGSGRREWKTQRRTRR